MLFSHFWRKAEAPYWAGGLAIGLANAALLAVNDKPWGITSVITDLGAKMGQFLGLLRPAEWAYYAESRAAALAEPWWQNPDLWVNVGIVLGVVLSAVVAGEFRWKRPKWRHVLPGLAGGLLMGYGARLAAGCNAGALLGGIPSLSLHGWIFAAVVMAGAAAGIWLTRWLHTVEA